MKKYELTQHAEARLQQRAIPELMLPLLFTYGEMQYQSGGVHRWYLPHRRRKQLRKQLKKLIDHFDSLENCYCVEADGKVITIAHEYD